MHTRNLASNAKGKCVFVLVAPNDRITSYIAGQVGGQDQISSCFNERKTKGLAKMVTSKNLCQRQKWGRSRPIHIFALLFLNLV